MDRRKSIYKVCDVTVGPRLVKRSESFRGDDKKKVKLKRKSLSFRISMSEGRKTQVILLDDRRLDLLVQPKLYSTELLDIVASHFNLKEKEYFGLSFKDETGHHHWLHLDRKVLEHEFPKKAGPLVLYFGIRFFIESIGYLRDNATIELFYLQAKQAVFKGHLEVDVETSFELAAHVLQATYGDHIDDETAKKQLKKLPVLPTSTLREHPSIGYCEEQVLAHYRKLEGHTRGSAIVNYMTIIESIPTYGIHFYEVKDKSCIPWWLGLSHKGISLYDYADKRIPRKVFAWKQLENLYFRDKKFSIEVHDPKRIVHTLSSFNLYEDAIQEPLEEFDELSDAISDPTTQVSVSRRTFGPGNVNVHAWLASTPLLTKCIWSMAVSQHQFYLDRKQSKAQLPQVRSMSEIATDLCHSSNSLHSSATNNSEGISRSNSAHSLTLSTYNSRTELTPEELEETRAAHTEMFQALQARKEALEAALKKKTEELKEICLKEGELTGILPIETPLAPGEPMPHIRRRVGTSFALSPKIMNRDKRSEVEEALARLELDLELQEKISKAAYKLAQDKSVAKSVRKQRKQQYHRSSQKLKDIEKKLNEYRERIGKIPLKIQNSVEESEFISPIGSPSLRRHENREVGKDYYTNSQRSPSTQQMKIITSPKVQVVEIESPQNQSRYSYTPRSNQNQYLSPHYKPNYSPQHTPQHTPTYSSFTSEPPLQQVPYHQRNHSSGRPHHGNNSQEGRSQQAPEGAPHPQHKSAPASPVRQPPGAPRVSTPSPNPRRHQTSGSSGGYIPNSVYSTRTQYRNQMYPTYSTKDHQHTSGSQSDYENSRYSAPPAPASQSSNRHVSRIDQENYRNVHNLYNVNSNKTACYDSTDELKSPTSEEYDSYSSDQEQGEKWHNTYPRGPESGDSQSRSYGSLDRNTRPNMMLAELSPSKFGSKRESHSDQRDSPYQIVDMPPPPPRTLSEMPHQIVAPNGYNKQYDKGPPLPDDVNDDTSSHNTSIPYIDCSQSSISTTGAPWYDPKESASNRQQHGGGGYTYESPPTNAYVRQDVPTSGYDQRVPGGYEPNMSTGTHNSDSQYQSPPQVNQKHPTVTKYQSYVEVSKPFEMSDFYKYSERLRKQRITESPSSEGSGSSSQSSYHPPQSQPAYPQRSHSHSHPHSHPHSQSQQQSQGSVRGQLHQGQGHPAYSSQSSVSSSRSRPSSPSPYPYTGTPQENSSSYSKHPSSPYQSTPPPTGGAQSSLVQTSYQHMPVAQQQPNSQYQQRVQQSPKHIAYQPPKPMTCEPIRDSPAHNSTANQKLSHRITEDTMNSTFGSFNPSPGIAEAFSEEMLAWYDDRDIPTNTTRNNPKHTKRAIKFI